MRTVTMPAAQTGADQMAQELPGLQGTTSVLLGHGTTLADPENWDGRTAQEFHTTVWPSYERALTDVHVQLDKLKTRLSEIQAKIVSAG